MTELVAMETNNKDLMLEVDLGYVCNYRCSYCPPALHEGKEWVDKTHLINFLEASKPKLVVFPGGEPTLYPEFVDLIIQIKNRLGAGVSVVTNAFRGAKWWNKHHHLMDQLTFSYHHEYTNIETFIKTIKAVTQDRFITVNVPIQPSNFDEMFNAVTMIKDRCINTYIAPKILVDYKTGLTIGGYTKTQKMFISKVIHPKIKTYKQAPYRMFIRKVYSDGTKQEVRPQTLIANGENDYRGWKCWKGLQFMKVAPNGDVYLATCEVSQKGTKPIGNINDLLNINWPTEPQICNKEMCNCITALKGVRKEKV